MSVATAPSLVLGDATDLPSSKAGSVAHFQSEVLVANLRRTISGRDLTPDAAREGTSPGLRRIARLSGVEMKELYQLFPQGPGKLAARIAGLPKPTSCV